MNTKYIIYQLGKHIPIYKEMLFGISNELIAWRPQPDKWNLLEVICHLYDEEREDFRSRLKHVLDKPTELLPEIDPQGWVESRGYASKNYHNTLNEFISERTNSVSWLKSLKNPPLENVFQHPKFGAMSGKMFLSNWLAHDYLHFRQILKIKHGYLSSITGEKLDYAGTW